MKGSGRTLLWQALGGWGAALPEVPRHLMSGLYMAQVDQPKHRSPCLGRQVWRRRGFAVIVGPEKQRTEDGNVGSDVVVTVGAGGGGGDGAGGGGSGGMMVIVWGPDISAIENAATAFDAATACAAFWCFKEKLLLLLLLMLSLLLFPCCTHVRSHRAS